MSARRLVSDFERKMKGEICDDFQFEIFQRDKLERIYDAHHKLKMPVKSKLMMPEDLRDSDGKFAGFSWVVKWKVSEGCETETEQLVMNCYHLWWQPEKSTFGIEHYPSGYCGERQVFKSVDELLEHPEIFRNFYEEQDKEWIWGVFAYCQYEGIERAPFLFKTEEEADKFIEDDIWGLVEEDEEQYSFYHKYRTYYLK